MTDEAEADDKRVGSNVRFARQEKGLSQAALAESMRAEGQAHWRQTTVSRVERGDQKIAVGEIRALERILGPGTVLAGTDTDQAMRAIGLSVERGVALRHLRRVAESLKESAELVQDLRAMYADPRLGDDDHGEHPEA
ncbi:helix-turn-helix domain-containing protein [Janibacter hoylei]|uniref:helix-turn-helix domain-containing protein n=1 Tax=Janibacter hoylei TaxID=364298 RepID=UPI0021A71F37|nr:helix-turn-helix transcriptional regulator [Janibacter hoylei]MCT1618497.1 helix-turn-helix domain-containing protein [Janibacter hoylei]MCT2294091.1 helix-turn-helix domain-containing protein [Janibacter hoylei]